MEDKYLVSESKVWKHNLYFHVDKWIDLLLRRLKVTDQL